jgi:hypothetical protein
LLLLELLLPPLLLLLPDLPLLLLRLPLPPPHWKQ